MNTRGAIRVVPWLTLLPLGMLALSGCAHDATAGEQLPIEAAADNEQLAGPATPEGESAELGPQLYAQHCAACHGDRGDGNGIAATFLFPKPRDLRAGRFRLVSTNNNVPTRDDLHAVLLRGMPGSSMPPWGHLNLPQRDALVDEVMRMRRTGAQDFYIRQLIEDEGLTDDEIAEDDVQDEIQEFVDDTTTASESTDVPPMEGPTADAIARGQQFYTHFACHSCHGETGRGDGVMAMFDDEGMPIVPRDFTRGIFKGNPDPASLFRRIAYGMPGTPMPSATAMTPDQMVDVVHFLRSLSTEEQRQAAVLNRKRFVANAIRRIPQSENDAVWSRTEPVPLQMMPLWWRNDADPDLTVQALHDGHEIAFRLSWRDATRDEHALASETFEDAVAMQLYRGDAEPFLGMGDATAPVDVWFWDADRQRGEIAADEIYPNMVVDMYPLSEVTVRTAEMDRPGTRMADQPEVSLPARASGNLIVPSAHEAGGSSLQVGGPGSVTFRNPQSQLVDARGSWNGGRWTVVMRRQLAVTNPSDGVSLKRGERVSVAFAVWDGAYNDRDGQKSITIWQDLEIE